MYGSVASIIIELAVVGLLVIGIVAGVKKGFFKRLFHKKDVETSEA